MSAPPDAAPAVAARGLRKTYGTLEAVAGVDVTVRAGDVYGYLGPNGAGKTTSLRMMLGLIQPTAGEVRLFGRDPVLDPVSALEGVAGFVEDPAFYPYLSGRANLELLADLDGGGDGDGVAEVLEVVELTGRAGDRVRGYSHGMRQRLGLAAALLRRPRLLVLDEPTTGLDPGGMRDMRALVRRLAGEGITVLLSSHLMGEVEALCNRVAILREGRVRYEGDLAEVTARSDGRYRLQATDPGAALAVCRAADGVHDMRAEGPAIAFAAEPDAVAALTLALAAAGIGIHALVPSGGLEALFFDLTEQEAGA
ncbi:MAG TPA: ATP-binding cassette domain-containing protein [Gaiellales bacterium]|nr:ATP-binding cassette domain-containing protein [Gaiellales bacterium]